MLLLIAFTLCFISLYTLVIRYRLGQLLIPQHSVNAQEVLASSTIYNYNIKEPNLVAIV
jgi:hypothetical protein